MSRKLASVRKIIDIKPIEGADMIEVATVDGWDVVVAKKDGFKVGDLVCYFEIDSFLPTLEQFGFLAKSSTKKMGNDIGYRLKTIRLRGQISQGLIMPISSFKLGKVKEGDDLTDKIGVKLYEPFQKPFTMSKPKGARGKFYVIKNKVEKVFPKTEVLFRFLDKVLFGAKYVKKFPNFIKKTDQERIQNLVSRLDTFRDIPFEVTIKLDGSSLTIFKNGNKTGVCSRNLDVSDETNNYTLIEKKYGIIEGLKKYKKNIAIQGEMIGPAIQGNPENISEVDFYVFDVYDIDKRRYLTREERMETLEDLECLGLKLNHVPLFKENFYLGDMTLEDILKMAEGPSLFNNNREGLVFKSEELVDKGTRTLSFKAISNKYLLAEKD